MVYPDRFHQSVAIALPISGKLVIYMLGIKAMRTMVSG
jgi:hypothetical protein